MDLEETAEVKFEDINGKSRNIIKAMDEGESSSSVINTEKTNSL